MNNTAYRSIDPAVLTAWEKFVFDSEVLRTKRDALSKAYGRDLMVNRLGFGHGTRVVGFQRLEGDKDGDLLADGALRVLSSRTSGSHTVQPNLRRKAGKELAAELRKYNSPTLDLDGMPQFHLGGGGDVLGIRSHAPALFEHEGAIYALWGTDSVPVQTPPWEQIPLSVYYAAQEAREAVA